MPSERVQRQIDGFLDQAEEALQARDWDKASDLVQRVLSIDSTNGDAQTFLKLAEARDSEAETPGLDAGVTAPVATPDPTL